MVIIPVTSRWLLAMIIDWFVIVGTLYIAAIHGAWVIWWLCSLVIGNRLHAIGVLGHDGAHYSAATNRKLNNGLTAMLAFWPLGISLTGYRASHFAHHRYVGTPQDTELWAKARMPGYSARPQSTITRTVYTLKDLTLLSCFDFIVLYRLLVPYIRSKLICPIVAAGCLASILAAIDPRLLALVLFALCTSFLACFRLRVWGEHQAAPQCRRGLLARMLYAPHYTWLHEEHHERPWLPYWRLLTVYTLKGEA